MSIVFSGRDGVRTYQAITLKHALTFYAKHRMKINTSYTPKNMMRVASQITGKAYKARAYAEAINDLDKWIQINGTNGEPRQ